MSHLANDTYQAVEPNIGKIEPQVIIDLIDKHIKEIYYRNFLTSEEIAHIMTDIGAEWTPAKGQGRGATNTTVTNLLLDARLSLMTEGEGNGELQEELDALIGADIDSS